MKIVVCVKQVADPNTVAVDIATNRILREDLAYVINTHDLFAVEQALRVREKLSGEVTLLSIGPASSRANLVKCLGLGADRAILLRYEDAESLDSYSAGAALAAAITHLGFDLVLCGVRALDTNSGQVGAVIAETLGVSLISAVEGIEFKDGGKTITAERRLEKGWREVVETSLPSVITIEAGRESPRYASLTSLINAARKKVEEYDIAGGQSAIPVSIEPPRLRSTAFMLPRPRPKKLFVPDSNLSPAERMRLLMSGGIAKKSGNLLEGEPQQLASQVAQYLKQVLKPVK